MVHRFIFFWVMETALTVWTTSVRHSFDCWQHTDWILYANLDHSNHVSFSCFDELHSALNRFSIWILLQFSWQTNLGHNSLMWIIFCFLTINDFVAVNPGGWWNRIEIDEVRIKINLKFPSSSIWSRAHPVEHIHANGMAHNVRRTMRQKWVLKNFITIFIHQNKNLPGEKGSTNSQRNGNILFDVHLVSVWKREWKMGGGTKKTSAHIRTNEGARTQPTIKDSIWKC